MSLPPEYPPVPDSQAGLRALRSMVDRQGWRLHVDPLQALRAFHATTGDVFQLQLRGFRPIVLVGPEAARFIFVTHRQHLLWRNEDDAIARLLRHGLLVEDGPIHDEPRRVMDPALHRRQLTDYVDAMLRYTDQVTSRWADGSQQDMLIEMRRITLLILFDTLFGIDATPDLERLWQPILRALSFISPGLWLIWPDMPRPSYTRPLSDLDRFLYQLIDRRRAAGVGTKRDDLLGRLIAAPNIDDNLIRDQMMTMLIAGHDTSTALLAWALFLLGRHPAARRRLQSEVDEALGDRPPAQADSRQLPYLSRVVRETLRLYPPAHAAMRRATTDLEFQDYVVPAGSRIMFSIYLTHRHPRHWERPDDFWPDRFLASPAPPYAYVPFGGGPRTCIGAAFGLLEAEIVLARVFQRFELSLAQARVHTHMGATLEPRPGVLMNVRRRSGSRR